MAITKTAKVEAEIENSEIVGIVRGMSIPLDQLATMLTTIRDGGAKPAPTSGQKVQKSTTEIQEDADE